MDLICRSEYAVRCSRWLWCANRSFSLRLVYFFLSSYFHSILAHISTLIRATKLLTLIHESDLIIYLTSASS